MLSSQDDEFRRLEQDTSIKPGWAPEAFDDREQDARQSIAPTGAVHSFPARTRSEGLSTTSKAGG
jgi:hypothetical protein